MAWKANSNQEGIAVGKWLKTLPGNRGRLPMKKNKRQQLTKEQILEQWKAREKDIKAQKVDKNLQNTN